MSGEQHRPVVVAGHLCIDLVPALDGPPTLAPGRLGAVGALALRPGGCVANTGLGLAQLGAPTRLVAQVGDDHLGHLLARLLEHPLADTAGVRAVPAPSSYSLVVEAPGHDRTFWHHVGPNATFDASGLGEPAVLAGADLLHLGYPTALPALLPASGRRLLGALGRARAAGLTTSVDLSGVDPSSPAAGADWPALLDRWLPAVDVLAASLDDLDDVLGPGAGHRDDPAGAARALVARGAGAVLLKAGARGLVLATGAEGRLRRAGRALAPAAPRWAGRALWAPAAPVAVRTTAGAGDAAVAGLLLGITRGMGPAGALGAAARAAAARVGGHGTLPCWDELAGLGVPAVRPAPAAGGAGPDNGRNEPC